MNLFCLCLSSYRKTKRVLTSRQTVPADIHKVSKEPTAKILKDSPPPPHQNFSYGVPFHPALLPTDETPVFPHIEQK